MIFIVMGVSGCGKTTIGKKLAENLRLPFYDADDFHSQSNIEKMQAGIPLTDTDRMPWLEKLAENIQVWEKTGGAVLACSALKEQYRRMLSDRQQITWVFLDASRETILARLKARKAHFMSSTLLDSQLNTLEKPAYGIHVDGSASCDLIIQDILLKLHHMASLSEFGLIGLGVMGKSLALNLAGKGVRVALYNRHVAGKEEGIAAKIIAETPSLVNLKGFETLDDFVQSLEKPRKLLLMIYAGATDSQIKELLPLLEAGDVIIDGGNSNYKDTSRREQWLEAEAIHYLGAGVSGGEEGARKGPSIMAGGSERAYELAGKYLELLAARDKSGKPCAIYTGPDGSGHFVKMVHNGIEYAEMQLLSEVYSLLRDFLKMTARQIADLLHSWQGGELGSYLLEITIDILQVKEGNEMLLDKILDQAGQKGTGGLSVAAALDYAVPYGPLSEAVMARLLSSMKEERIHASGLYAWERPLIEINQKEFISSLKNAYQACRIINHEIGFNLIRQASVQHKWDLNLSEIARIWTNGCIIRSVLMEQLTVIFENEESILTAPSIIPQMRDWQKDLASVTAQGIQQGFALPVFSAALNYFLAYITADSTANLIQAQRDYFGAHTYQRKDRPADQYFHTLWKSI